MRYFRRHILLSSLLASLAISGGALAASADMPDSPGFFCSSMKAWGMSGGVFCKTPPKEDLPPSDIGVLDFKPTPPPAPPPPPPEPVVIKQPPVKEKIIERVVVREIPIVMPPPAPAAPPPPPPDYEAIAAAEALATRRGGQSWNEVAVVAVTAPLDPATLGQDGEQSVTSSTITNPPPLKVPPLAATASKAMPEGIYKEAGQISSFPKDNSRVLTTDRYITGILETSINTQLGGAEANDGKGGSKPKNKAIIQVSRDVYGYHNRFPLIPKGSRMVCEYSGPDKQGVSRVAITCPRILTAENRLEIFNAAGVGSDVQGRAGITGEVDNRFWEKYGTAFIIAGVSAAVRLGSASATSSMDNSAVGQTLDQGAEELSTKLGDITASVLEQTVDLNPIVTIPQGTRITILPAVDWYIQDPNNPIESPNPSDGRTANSQSPSQPQRR